MEIGRAIRESYRNGACCPHKDKCPELSAGKQCVVHLGFVCRDEDRGFKKLSESGS